MSTTIPRRPLGATGEMVSAIGLGGSHIGKQTDEQESIAIIRHAIDHGVTFLDNAWMYNDGVSEVRMGKALRDGYRQRAFLMTKFQGRDAVTATKQLEESLARLQTDCIDLWQLHETLYMSDAERIFAPGGAIEAMIAAKKAGKVRLLGFTGHKSPDLHLNILRVAGERGFRFDTVQMPLNVLDAHFDSFERRVLPLLNAQHIGVIAMKPLAGGILLQQNGMVTKQECLRYVQSLPISVGISGCVSMAQLDELLEAGRAGPLSPTECAAVLARTRTAALDGALEQYKTGTRYDGSPQHPEWLGPQGVLA